MAKKKAAKKKSRQIKVTDGEPEAAPQPIEACGVLQEGLQLPETDKPPPTNTPKEPKKRAPPVFGIGRLHMCKDPETYATRISAKRAGWTRMAGIDLGTSCGISFADVLHTPQLELQVIMGQWDLSLGPYDSGPLRHVRLKHFLQVLAPDFVCYEEVKFDPPSGVPVGVAIARVSAAAEFLGGLKTTLAVWCQEHMVPLKGYAITEIKKYATGKGNASKVDMINAINARLGVNFDPETYEQSGADNIADSGFCCLLGVEQHHEAFR